MSKIIDSLVWAASQLARATKAIYSLPHDLTTGLTRIVSDFASQSQQDWATFKRWAKDQFSKQSATGGPGPITNVAQWFKDLGNWDVNAWATKAWQSVVAKSVPVWTKWTAAGTTLNTVAKTFQGILRFAATLLFRVPAHLVKMGYQSTRGTVANLYREGVGKEDARTELAKAHQDVQYAEIAKLRAPYDLDRAKRKEAKAHLIYMSAQTVAGINPTAANKRKEVEAHAKYLHAQAQTSKADEAQAVAPENLAKAWAKFKAAQKASNQTKGFSGRVLGIGNVLGTAGSMASNVIRGIAAGGASGGVTGGLGAALGAAGGMISRLGGPWGMAIGGVITMGATAFKVTDTLRRWGDELHRSNMSLAEFSGLMAGVQARRTVQEVILSRQKGDYLSKSAGRLSDAQMASERAWAPAKVKWDEAWNDGLAGVYKGLEYLAAIHNWLFNIDPNLLNGNNNANPGMSWLGNNTFVDQAIARWEQEYGRPDRFMSNYGP